MTNMQHTHNCHTKPGRAGMGPWLVSWGGARPGLYYSPTTKGYSRELLVGDAAVWVSQSKTTTQVLLHCVKLCNTIPTQQQRTQATPQGSYGPRGARGTSAVLQIGFRASGLTQNPLWIELSSVCMTARTADRTPLFLPDTTTPLGNCNCIQAAAMYKPGIQTHQHRE